MVRFRRLEFPPSRPSGGGTTKGAREKLRGTGREGKEMFYVKYPAFYRYVYT